MPTATSKSFPRDKTLFEGGAFPMFPTSLMGSLPRSKEVLSAQRALRKGTLERRRFDELVGRETEKMVRFQEEAGIDIITSGEQGRDNYVSFVADRLDGVVLMSMSEMLDYIEDKKAFDEILDTLDVPASSIRNAICAGKLRHRGDIVQGELALMRRFTDRPVKVTLPGPYLLTRSLWLPALSGAAYDSKEALGKDVIGILTQEVAALQEAGVEVIQFDEPVLTEVVFTEGKPRSFMCAALSERKDPKEELLFASGLIKEVLGSIDRQRSVAALHVCRGNWSTDESILLSGPYTPLLDVFAEAQPDTLILEFSTPRAGELASLLDDARIAQHVGLGLGVINPRTETVEDAQSIVDRAEEALGWIAPERLWLNPDCGFATFANRPVNHLDTIAQKASALTEAARRLRRRYGS
jgi:5-methyltetrahydropteroyltriglutamate--homocysteine methyltransferase